MRIEKRKYYGSESFVREDLGESQASTCVTLMHVM